MPMKLRTGAEIQAQYSLSHSGHHVRINDGTLPSGVKQGNHWTRYFQHEYEAVFAARAAGAGDEETRQLVRNLKAVRTRLIGMTGEEIRNLVREQIEARTIQAAA